VLDDDIKMMLGEVRSARRESTAKARLERRKAKLSPRRQKDPMGFENAAASLRPALHQHVGDKSDTVSFLLSANSAALM
jgi:hypothetical protein